MTSSRATHIRIRAHYTLAWPRESAPSAAYALYASKRRASTPSPSVVPVPKAYCPTTAATTESSALLHDAVAMEQASATYASITTLDPDGQIKAALDGAPAYMQHFYLLLKSSHDSSAVAFAELRSSHTANVAALAENACALTENARMLNTVSSRVDEIDQRQQTSSTRHDADIARLEGIIAQQNAAIARQDADIAAARADIVRSNSGNNNQYTQTTIDDPREIVVRDIPLTVPLEPLPLANVLLTACHRFARLEPTRSCCACRSCPSRKPGTSRCCRAASANTDPSSEAS